MSMKKVFVEPEMKKIELNLKENIAVSGEVIGYHFLQFMTKCTIQYTDFTIYHEFSDDQVAGCLIYANEASTYGTVVTQEELRLYKRNYIGNIN